MVNSMVEAIMNPNNKKIAFITFKIVEETIKRSCLKTEIENYSLVSTEQLNNMKYFMNQSYKYKNDWKKPNIMLSLGASAYASNNSGGKADEKGRNTSHESSQSRGR